MRCSKTPTKSRRLLFVDLPDVWRPGKPGRRASVRKQTRESESWYKAYSKLGKARVGIKRIQNTGKRELV